MPNTFTVGTGPYQGDTNEAIQKALDDAAKAGGGTVRVPKGTYTLHNAVRLRSNVRLVGEEGTVLRKAPCVSSELTHFLGYGHYEFAVREPEKFSVGQGIHLLDQNAGGFYTTVATIIDQDDEGLFYMDRMANHDYLPASGGRVVTIYPLIEGEGVENAGVENLTLDGNKDENEPLNGCRGGGVFLIQCRNVTIQDVEVRDYNGDAISFQQCHDVTFDRCHLHDNTGSGLHPGSGSVRYVMQNCTAHANGTFGLFYCLRTTHSICRDNTFTDNGAAGISIGERDTDHLIEGNTVTGNGGVGVEFRVPMTRSGDRVRLERNAIGPNCRKEGDCEIHVPAGLSEILIAHNRITPADGNAALRVDRGARRVWFVDNLVHDNPQEPGNVAGDATTVGFEQPADFPDIRPEALRPEGAKHLNIERLPAWIGR